MKYRCLDCGTVMDKDDRISTKVDRVMGEGQIFKKNVCPRCKGDTKAIDEDKPRKPRQ